MTLDVFNVLSVNLFEISSFEFNTFEGRFLLIFTILSRSLL